MRKTVKSLLLAGVMVLLSVTPAFAGQWQSNAQGWWYQNDDGSYPADGWQWIDGKCYYFTSQGYCLVNATTPEGYTVDASGAWVVNGVVQQQNTASANAESFEAGWIYGTYECHDGIDATAELGWNSGDDTDYIYLSGATKDGGGVSEFLGEVVSSKGNNYTAVDEAGNAVDYYYNGIDTLEITSSGSFGGMYFPGFDGLYHKVEDLSHNVS